MSATSNPYLPPRLDGWRRFLQRRGLERNPTSVMRRRISLILLSFMAAGMGLYLYTTRDEAIRLRVLDFFRAAAPHNAEVYIERATFHMFGGITLYNVRVCVPFDRRLDPLAFGPDERRFFSARSVKVIHNPWQLLLGKLSIEHVIAIQPIIFLTQNVDTGLRNWELLTGASMPGKPGKAEDRPTITLRAAKAVVVSIDANGKRDMRVEQLDADVRPHPQHETGYCIEVRRYTEPVDRTTVLFDPGQRLVANSPFVDARTVRLQLPRPAQQLFDTINLEGEVKLSRMLYEAQAGKQRDTQIELRNVKCRVPLWLLDKPQLEPPHSTTQPADSAENEDVVRMVDVSGSVTLHGDELRMDVSGMINGAKCRVWGHLNEIEGPPGAMGMELNVKGDQVPTPEGPIRRRLMEDPSVPEAIRVFFVDYDPHGPFNAALKIVRASGPDRSVDITGVVQPQGVSGRFIEFPFVLDEVYGQVRFDPPYVYVENLDGWHGSGRIRINAAINYTTRFPTVDVTVTGASIPMDDNLHRSLSPEDQEMWDRFHPTGVIDVNVNLHRPGAITKASWPPWKNQICLELIDAQAYFPPYPAPLDHVEGHLEFGDKHVTLENVIGHCDEGAVRVNGYVQTSSPKGPETRVHVEATHIPLDDKLFQAFPPEGQGTLVQFQPEGFVNFSGELTQEPGQSEMRYDLTANVFDSRVRYKEFPYPINDVNGEITISPEKFSIVTLQGRHGDSVIKARGEVACDEDDYCTNLVFESPALTLDDDLHSALTDALKSVWNFLRPEGRVRVRTGLYFASENGTDLQRHRTDIEPLDASFTFRGLPLPISAVTGKVLITNNKVEILNIHGTTGGGTVEIQGEINLDKFSSQGTLTLHAKDMTFDDALIAAMPTQIQDALRAVHPRGQFDLDLDPLQFTLAADGKSTWDFRGEMRLAGASGNFGIEWQDSYGVITGTGSIAEDGRVQLDARANLSHANAAGWAVDNFTARFLAPRDSHVITVNDIAAKFYDGDATGYAEIEWGPHQSKYQASFTAKDVQLAKYLESRRRLVGEVSSNKRSDLQYKTTRGAISGNLVLRGETGPGGFREGAGEVELNQAQVWKLPVFLAIFQVLNLAPDENVFHDGRLQFFLSDDTLTLQKIDLQGAAMSFIGGGNMRLADGHIDVTLLAGSPVRLRVPLLTDLLEGASREMMELRLTGTLDKPNIRPQPLRGLTTALKTLFPEAPRTRQDRPVSLPKK